MKKNKHNRRFRQGIRMEQVQKTAMKYLLGALLLLVILSIIVFTLLGNAF